jgi:hypothetical protein
LNSSEPVRARGHKASREITPEQAADKVKDVAKTIREISSTARDTVKKFRESGAITEPLFPFFN